MILTFDAVSRPIEHAISGDRLPLLERKKRLVGVISDTVPAVQLVEGFSDGAALLAACAKMGLEGVV